MHTIRSTLFEAAAIEAWCESLSKSLLRARLKSQLVSLYPINEPSWPNNIQLSLDPTQSLKHSPHSHPRNQSHHLVRWRVEGDRSNKYRHAAAIPNPLVQITSASAKILWTNVTTVCVLVMVLLNSGPPICRHPKYTITAVVHGSFIFPTVFIVKTLLPVPLFPCIDSSSSTYLFS